MVDSLASLRVESKARVERLVNAAVRRADAGSDCKKRIHTRTEGFESELKALREQKEVMCERARQLSEKRDSLQTQLRALTEELETVLEACEGMEEREQQLVRNADRVAGELQRELDSREAEGQSLAVHQRLLSEVGAASCDVEALLQVRAESAKAALDTKGDSHKPEVASACLSCEQARNRQLEELSAGLHMAVWGGQSAKLATEPMKVGALRKMHSRAIAVTDQAWREMIQMAAEELYDSTLTSTSEELSRTAERYKLIKHELQSNIERLGKLVTTARPVGPNPSGSPPASSLPSSSQTTALEGGLCGNPRDEEIGQEFPLDEEVEVLSVLDNAATLSCNGV